MQISKIHQTHVSYLLIMKSLTFLLSSFLLFSFGQTGWNDHQKRAKPESVIYTQDILNFWEAYDRIQETEEYSEKRAIMREYYTDKASKGLKAYMEMRRVDDSLYVALIEELPKFWDSVREKTMESIQKGKEIHEAIERLRTNYPELKPAEIYLFVGGLVSGGSVFDNLSLIACEISAADASVDLSELENSNHSWVVPFIRSSNADQFVQMNVHEYGHTQQGGYVYNVLCKSLSEGAADFIAEVGLGKPIQSPYITYGLEHLEVLKKEFLEDMFTDYVDDWMYAENSRGHVRDLGYFMGYAICKAYFEKAKDKKAAIKTIIELDHTDLDAVLAFLNASDFYEETITKPEPVKYPDQSFQVVFQVTVPEEGDELFIAGDRPEMGDWEPGAVQLKKTGPTTREIELSLQPPIQFKFTRGDWQSQARVAEGRGWTNLRRGFYQDTVLTFHVTEWQDRQ